MTALSLLTCEGSGQAATPDSRALVELTEIDSPGISPNGRFLAFRTVRGNVGRNSYDLEWHVIDLVTGRRQSLGSGGAPVYIDPGMIRPEPPLWTADGRLVVRALIDGAVGLWQARPEGQALQPLLVRDEDIEDVAIDGDGKALRYTVGPSRALIVRAEQAEYDRGILVDGSIDLAQPLFRGGSVDGRMASQRFTGYWYLRAGLTWREPRQSYLLDLATGRSTPAAAPIIPDRPDPAKLIPTLRAVSQSGNIASLKVIEGRSRLVIEHSGGKRTLCPEALCGEQRISDFAWRSVSDELIVTLSDAWNRQTLLSWDVPSGAVRSIAGGTGLLSGGRREGIPCALGKDAFFCVAAEAASPPRLERIDLDSGERKILYAPNAEAWRSYRPAVRWLRWRTEEGRMATAQLLSAPGTSSRAPLFLNYYRCEGFLRGGEGDEWPIPDLLEAGFMVACLDALPFKGAQDSAATYRTAVAAIRPLIRQLASAQEIDPRKVAMGGLSFGSEAAFQVATQTRLLAALSIASTQLEPAGYWMSAVPGNDQPALYRRVWGLGPPAVTKAAWRRVTPVYQVAKIATPVLFQMPEQEARRIPELYARLSLAKVPTELFAYPDEAHIKVQPRHRLAVYDRNRDWFRYWLQDWRDPDPAKGEQYRRWDRLRAAWRSPSGARATPAATVPAPPSR